LISSI